jgi:hypothetical protein
MTFLDVQVPQRKIFPALTASLALFLASAISITGMNFFGAWMSFGFLPLLVLSMWPRQANTLISLGLVFFLGLFTDWAGGAILGQWALIFVLVWGFLRPETRESPYSALRFFLVWLAICGLALCVICGAGYFVFGILPDFKVIGRQMILATICLPFILVLRGGLSRLFGDLEDRYR